MSTRHARTADKATNEKHTSILKALLQKAPNKYCADCRKKETRWASWNLGIFICIRCSGIHRSLGVHISKVKSVDLDTWVPDQVENMVRWGNERANKYWEANLRDRKPNENNMEMWIRAKYEQKKWAMKGPIPDPRTLSEEETSDTQAETSPVRQSPAPQKQQIQEKPKQSEFANLDAFLNSPSPASQQQQSVNKPASQQLQGANFFDPLHNTTMNTASQSDKKQQNFNDIKASIMSLYNTPSPQQQQQQQMSGNFYNQMAGLNLGGQQPTSNNNNNNNTWNSFGTTNQTMSNNNTNDIWSSFGTAPQKQQQQQPQGSQFFTSNTNNKQPEKRDPFADLLG